MGNKSTTKNRRTLKKDFTPAKFVLFIFPFIIEALIASLTMGANDAATVLVWSLLIFVFGLSVFPLTAKIFSKFGSGGFILAQALGIIFTSLLIWTFTYMNITRFNLPCTIGAFVVLTAVCWGVKPLREAAISKMTEPYFTERAVTEELAFLVILSLMCYFKGFLPDINGQEKYMDYGFIMSMLRNDTLPAKDMWLAGKNINYYYFGQFMWAMVIKCSQIKPQVAYNVAMCTATALPFAMTFSFGTMLIETAAQHGFRESPLPKYLAGTLTGFAVSIWGNSHSFFYDPDSFGHKFLPLFAKMGCDVGTTDSFFYPDSTRYIGYNPELTVNGGDYTIEEFPFYSYLIGDLHAHVISMMVIIIVACLMLALINSAAYPDSIEKKTKRNIRNLIPDGGRLVAEFKVTVTMPLVFSAVLLGAAQMTNYWDFLFYFIFCSMAVLIVNTRISKVFTDIWSVIYFLINTAFILSFYLISGSDPLLLISLETVLMVFAYLFSVIDPSALSRTAFQMSFLFTVGHLVALPFNLKFDMISNSLGRVKNNSAVYQLFILWGTHVIICLVFFVWVAVTKNYHLNVNGSKKKTSSKTEAVITEDYCHDGWTNPIQKFFGTRNIADVFICGITIVGILFIIAPEIFYVRDIYTDGYLRSNTMFKFTFAAFIMLSEAMCYAAVRFIWFVNKKGNYSTPALVAGFVSIILMVIPAHYTWLSLSQRSGTMTKENYNGLDGTKYIYEHSSGDCYEEFAGNLVCYLKAAEWFNQNVKGSPVICEGYGDSYTDRCIISAYTGLPTVFGWQTHEWLWRFQGVVDKTKDVLVADPEDDVWNNLIVPRQNDVNNIYEATDKETLQSYINKYKIEYLVLGSMEYSQYDIEDVDLFYEMFGEPVFTYEDLVIFKTTPSQA